MDENDRNRLENGQIQGKVSEKSWFSPKLAILPLNLYVNLPVIH